jgi:SH3 domain protein
MKTKLFHFVMLVFLVTPLLTNAETMYVDDKLEATVRGGKGVEFKILAIVNANEKVEVSTIEDQYAFVSLENGIEGWMLKRFLTKDLPKPIVIASLRAELDRLKEKNKGLKEDNRTLREEKTAFEKDNTRQAKEIKKLEGQYEGLKSSSADFIQLRDNHEKLKKELIKSNASINTLNQKNQELKNYATLMWFIAGATTLLIGLVIGLIIQNLRYKRRKSISF